MDALTTSPASAVPTAGTLRGEWHSYLTFLKRPHLPERALPASGRSVLATGRMLVLDLLIMGTLTALAGVLVAVGLELPENELAKMDLSTQLVLLIVLVAPLSEELIFRGWMSGRPGHVLAVLLVALGLGAMAVFPAGAGDPHLLPLAAVGGAFLLALVALFAFRKRGAWRWFAWAFPVFFWLATLAFALVHLFNYEEGSLIFLLPFVIPQFILGSILGYLRVHYGLWSAIALHMAHNALLVGIVALAMQASGAEM